MSMKKLLVFVFAAALLSGCHNQKEGNSAQPITIEDHSENKVYQAQKDDKGQVQLSEGKDIEEKSAEENKEKTVVKKAEQTKDPSPNMLAQAKEEFEAGHVDAAAGSLKVLEEEDGLSDEAEKLKNHIQQAQVADLDAHSPEASDTYKIERHSQIAADDYYQETQEDIKKASDQEIEYWKAASSVQVEKATEKEGSVLDHLIQRLGIQPEDYEFIIQEESDDQVLVEIRQSQAAADAEVSNLIGIFKLDQTTNQLQKLNVLTGEFENY